jgi:hypothetical protein
VCQRLGRLALSIVGRDACLLDLSSGRVRWMDRRPGAGPDDEARCVRLEADGGLMVEMKARWERDDDGTHAFRGVLRGRDLLGGAIQWERRVAYGASRRGVAVWQGLAFFMATDTDEMVFVDMLDGRERYRMTVMEATSWCGVVNGLLPVMERSRLKKAAYRVVRPATCRFLERRADGTIAPRFEVQDAVGVLSVGRRHAGVVWQRDRPHDRGFNVYETATGRQVASQSLSASVLSRIPLGLSRETFSVIEPFSVGHRHRRGFSLVDMGLADGVVRNRARIEYQQDSSVQYSFAGVDVAPRGYVVCPHTGDDRIGLAFHDRHDGRLLESLALPESLFRDENDKVRGKTVDIFAHAGWAFIVSPGGVAIYGPAK